MASKEILDEQIGARAQHRSECGEQPSGDHCLAWGAYRATESAPDGGRHRSRSLRPRAYRGHYSTASTSRRRRPAGVSTSTTSPARRPSSARPTGDSSRCDHGGDRPRPARPACTAPRPPRSESAPSSRARPHRGRAAPRPPRPRPGAARGGQGSVAAGGRYTDQPLTSGERGWRCSASGAGAGRPGATGRPGWSGSAGAAGVGGQNPGRAQAACSLTWCRPPRTGQESAPHTSLTVLQYRQRPAGPIAE